MDKQLRTKMYERRQALGTRFHKNPTKQGKPIAHLDCSVAPQDIPDSSDECYSKVSHSTNWSEEEEISPQLIDNEQMRAADFEHLQNLPAAAAQSHFQFSSEKKYDEDIDFDKSTSSYFTLNLVLLNSGLSAIPFYKRLDYSTSLFSNKQIQAMNEEAEKAETAYQEIVKDFEKGVLANPSRKSSAASNKSASKPASASKAAVTPAVPENDGKDDELDELLNMTESKKEETPGAAAPSELQVEEPAPAADPSPQPEGENKDMQEWLDNVLEE